MKLKSWNKKELIHLCRLSVVPTCFRLHSESRIAHQQQYHINFSELGKHPPHTWTSIVRYNTRFRHNFWIRPNFIRQYNLRLLHRRHKPTRAVNPFLGYEETLKRGDLLTSGSSLSVVSVQLSYILPVPGRKSITFTFPATWYPPRSSTLNPKP